MAELRTEADDQSERPDLAKAEAELQKNLLELFAMPQSAWRVKVESRGVRLSVLPMKRSSVHCVRSEAHVNAPPRTVFNIYTNKDAWKVWQPDMTECRTLERLDAEREVMYVRYKVPVIENRDCCLVSIARPGTLDNPACADCYTVMSTSIKHPMCPKACGGYRMRLASRCGRADVPRAGEGLRPRKDIHVLHANPV